VIGAGDVRALAECLQNVLATTARAHAQATIAGRAWIASEFSVDRLRHASERALASLVTQAP
jgi:hypothetical protein